MSTTEKTDGKARTLNISINRIFLVAALLPLVGHLVGMAINPGGWMSNSPIIPYVMILVMLLSPLMADGVDAESVLLFFVPTVAAFAMMIAALVLQSRGNPNTKKTELGLALGTLTLSLIYAVTTAINTGSASEDEFTG